jgi:hypothetical protein
MMINKPRSLESILVAVLLVLMPAQQLFASVAILNVQPGPGGKSIVRSVTKETVTGDRFETNEKEIQQVLLSDGTSLTLGPGSTMVIESFTYDPQTQSGQLSIRLERGQFRIVGGLLNNTGNIAVQTPSGKLDLDNASVFVEVQANGATRASLLHGKSFKMTTNGHSETVERPAFEVVSTDANRPPKSPSNQDPKTVAADALALNSQALLGEEGGGGVGDPGGRGTLVLSSLSALGSETPFVSSSPTFNQGGGSGGTEGGGGGSEGGGGGGTGGGGGGGGTFPGRGITGTLNTSGGFGPGRETGAPNISGEQPSQFNGDKRSLAQVLDNAEVDGNGAYKGEATRDRGRTTNRLFNSRDSFTQVLLGAEKPMAVGDNEDFATPKFETADKNLQYVFFNDNSDNGGSGLSLAIDRAGIDLTGSHVLDERDAISRDFVVTAPFLLLGIELPQRNEIFKKDIETIVDPKLENFNAMGSIFKEATHFEILQAGFSHLGAGLVKREEDNFLLVEVRPGQVDQRLRDILKQKFVINNGEVNDRNGFVQAVDPSSNLTLTDAQIDLLAAIILKPNLKPGTPLTEADLVGAESFLDQFQRSEIITTVNAITSMSLDPNRTERFLFATGDVDGRLNPTFKKEFSVDRFFISAGLFTKGDGLRAQSCGHRITGCKSRPREFSHAEYLTPR